MTILREKFRPVAKASRSARAQKARAQKRADAAKNAWRKARQVLQALKGKVRAGTTAYGKSLSSASAATEKVAMMGAPNYPILSRASEEALFAELVEAIDAQIGHINSNLEDFNP